MRDHKVDDKPHFGVLILVYVSNVFTHMLKKCVFYAAQYFSRHLGKPTICIGENKGADQLRSNCEADQRLCIEQFLSFLNPKFQASSSFL